MRVHIYGLFDIRKPEEIRYVGQTENLAQRWKAHSTGRDATTQGWIKSVERSGGVAAIRILESCDPLNASAVERKWICASPKAINKLGREAGKMDFRISPIVTLAEMEVQYIRWALEYFEGNKRAAAAALGIGRQTLYNKMRHF